MSENEDNKGVTADIPAEAVEQALQSVARRPAAGEKGEGTEIPVVVAVSYTHLTLPTN